MGSAVDLTPGIGWGGVGLAGDDRLNCGATQAVIRLIWCAALQGDLRQVVLAQQTQAQSSQATQLRAAAALMSVGRRAETMIARLERS